MSLTIERLSTRCLVPRRLRFDVGLVETAARTELPRQSAGRLETRWPSDGRVCRIKRLHVRVAVPARDVSVETIAAAWAAGLATAIGEVLALPPGEVSGVAWAESQAAWRARFLADLAAGAATHRWEYEEFAAFFSIPARDAALALLLEDARNLAATLIELEALGALTRVLRLFDELACERLLSALEKAGFGGDGGKPEFPEIAAAGRLWLERGFDFADPVEFRRRALCVFVSEVKRQGARGSAAISELRPRRWWHALLAFRAMAERLLPIGGGLWLSAGVEAGEAGGRRLPPWLAAHLTRLLAGVRTGESQLLQLPEPLAAAMAGVRALPHGSAAALRDPGTWLSSSLAGIFLLAPVVSALNWPETIERRFGPRAVSPVLARVVVAAMTLEDAATPRRLDPALALFAGLTGEPDPLQIFDSTDESAICGALCQGAHRYDSVADHLVRAFAARVRGFRKSSRKFVVSRLLRVAGRICVRESEIAVILEPAAFHISLHSSGLDAPLAAQRWLGGRTVTFHLEGL